jgi:hypothetical protein
LENDDMIKKSFIKTSFTLAFVFALAMTACSKGEPTQQSATGSADTAQPPAATASGSTGQPSGAEATSSASTNSPAAPVATSREVTIPAGTPIRVTLVTPLASNTSKVEDAIRGTLGESIIVAGATAIPKGTPIGGTVLEALESGRVKGKASIALQFNSLDLRGQNVRIRTPRITREAETNRKEDVKKGGIGAGAGAIVGGIAGGGKGAAIGAAVGGTGAVLATKGEELEMPAGASIDTTLSDAITVLVPVN